MRISNKMSEPKQQPKHHHIITPISSQMSQHDVTNHGLVDVLVLLINFLEQLLGNAPKAHCVTQ